MTGTNTLLAVKIELGCIIVRDLSATGSTPCGESIQVPDIAQIVVERGEVGAKSFIHWFLKHRSGWTLHFNDEFLGANLVIQELQCLLGFSIPEVGSIAGPGTEGTVVWPTT